MDPRSVKGFWNREGLAERILRRLSETGKSLDAMTIDDLAPYDQFHGGGMESTDLLAQHAQLKPEMRVLDVGGGLGGPSRTLAVKYGCLVTTLDLAETYVEAAKLLTAALNLQDRVTHVVGNALELPFEAASFDVVWTQNTGMQIQDKRTLYQGFSRVLRPGGLLATQEPMLGPVGSPHYPLTWARDASESFILTPDELRSHMESAGFTVRVWDDVTERFPKPKADPKSTIQGIVVGEDLGAVLEATRLNNLEGRLVMHQAVLVRT